MTNMDVIWLYDSIMLSKIDERCHELSQYLSSASSFHMFFDALVLVPNKKNGDTF